MSYQIYIKKELTEAELKVIISFVNHHIGDFGLWCATRYGEDCELVDQVRLIAEDTEQMG